MSSEKRAKVWEQMRLKDIERRMLVGDLNYHNEQVGMIKKKIQKLDRKLLNLSDKHMNLYP